MLNLATPIEEYLPLPSITPDLTWYIVHTNVRGEWTAREALRKAGYGVVYPHFWKTIMHARKARDVRRPYYPRYLFVGLDRGQGLYDVNHAPGVSTVLYCAGEALEIPQNVVGEIASICDDDGVVDDEILYPNLHRKRRRIRELEDRYQRGERLRITAGPLTGFFALVELDNGREISVWVQDTKRQVKALLRAESVSPVGRSDAAAQ